ncbi:hypothetical protein [Agarivorans aestuarii]|uniref:hypothetical protein n=1 Tax=Agarivorans aestuarii TaxID=1563703 RepID=UPI001C7EAF0B|nr:hypothetical protein [Agarivorans aestuarii]
MLIDLITGFQLKLIKKKLKFFRSNKKFDLSPIDNVLEKLAVKRLKETDVLSEGRVKNSGSVAILATEIYDRGGHSPILVNLARSLKDDFSVHCFFTHLSKSKEQAPFRQKELDEVASVDGVNYERMKFTDNINSLYGKIYNSCCDTVFVFTHSDDLLASSVIALLKRDRKIIFYNHADHSPNLAMSQSDLILNFRIPAVYITQHFCNITKTTKIPLQSIAKNNTTYIDEVQQQDVRSQLGVKAGEKLTLSGFDNHKIFSDDSNQYLYLIKSLLVRNSNLKHLLISNLTDKQLEVLNEVFVDEPEARSRFLLKSMVNEFDDLFQSCDLFIDSFPLGSALTHIDMMRNRKPTVIKKSTKNSLYSFEEYLPDNYRYAFDTIDEMLIGVEFLLNNPGEVSKVVEENYQHYLENNEFSVVKEIYLNLVRDTDGFKSWVVPRLTEGSVPIEGLFKNH